VRPKRRVSFRGERPIGVGLRSAGGESCGTDRGGIVDLPEPGDHSFGHGELFDDPQRAELFGV
jgi:hypothetical protein